MKTHEFIQQVVDDVRPRLPDEWQAYQLRQRANQFQLHYGQPHLHYEVWVDHRFDHVEIGLHCEADGPTNQRLLAFFDRRLIEIRAESGEPLEAERWTPSWTRVHHVVKFDRLSPPLADHVAHSLAQLITVVQPILEDALSETQGRQDAKAQRVKGQYCD